MTDPFPPALALAVDPFWIVPVMGAVAFGLAVLVGRHLLAPKAPASTEEVPLDDTFLKGVTQDRRAAPRRKGSTVEVQLLAGGDAPTRGIVIDRSQGGLCILVEHPVEEGTVMKIRPTVTEITTPWTEVSVRSCRKEGPEYELGCQFTRMPNTSLLLQFG